MEEVQILTKEHKKAITESKRKLRNDIRWFKKLIEFDPVKNGHLEGAIYRMEDQLHPKLPSKIHNELEILSSIEKNIFYEEEIIKRSTPWRPFIGIYFLISGHEIVYVGQSKNIFSRIANHQDKIFDRFSYIACLYDELDILESMYIHAFSPKYNQCDSVFLRKHIKNYAPISIKKIKQTNIKHALVTFNLKNKKGR